jgi:L-alanine-DL-glutamate epimerase-like enolase superfamily enzyme
MKRTSILKRTGFVTRAREKQPKSRARTGLKSRQRAVSAVEAAYWDRLAREIGCIACRVAGLATSDYVSIHHIDGRTKPGCHMNVLPLCAGHHQQGTGNDQSLVAVHPNKARFEALYGTQEELRALCNEKLGVNP